MMPMKLPEAPEAPGGWEPKYQYCLLAPVLRSSSGALRAWGQQHAGAGVNAAARQPTMRLMRVHGEVM